MLPSGIKYFSHILVSLPESTNTLQGDVPPFHREENWGSAAKGAAWRANHRPSSRACWWSSPSPRCAKSSGPAEVGAKEAFRPMRCEARPVLRASGARRPSKGEKAGRNSETRPEPEARLLQASPARPPLPTLLPSPGGAGREHKRLQLPSGRGPTPPTPGPGRARGKEAGRKRQGGRELARMGRAGDPGRWVGWGSGGGSWDLFGLPGLPEWPKKRVAKNRQ